MNLIYVVNALSIVEYSYGLDSLEISYISYLRI